MKIENFIWDFDGTLLDTYDFLTSCLYQSLEKNGVQADINEVSDIIHISYYKATTYYAEKYNINIDDIHSWYSYFSKELDYTKIRTFDYVEDALKSIIASGGKNYIFTHRNKTVYEILERFNMLHYFEDIIDSTMPFPRKPSPEANLHLIEKHNLDKSKTIYVGDREIDVLCGRDAGILTCYFNTKSTCDIADYNIDSFKNFLDLFKN